MEMNKIIEIGAQLFKGKLGSSGGGLNMSDIVSALTRLVADNKGKIDLSSIVSNLDSEGLMSMAASWLGDGDNTSISSSQVVNLFGKTKITKFASQLGLDEGSALNGLTAAIPGIVDKSSSGGSLMDSIGGVSGALKGLKGLFG